MKFTLFWFALVLIMSCGCSSVKPYQRAYLNDTNMKPGALNTEGFEQSVFNYREGALQTGSSKGKGGCGCN